jgi:hypothetical protein
MNNKSLYQTNILERYNRLYDDRQNYTERNVIMQKNI